ncbi:hypothetical protein ASD47_15580 [Caulobacter sp. Root1472]|nr:hypothetical protein ASD47_15580 [Caulobacter sp. Root1472]
MEGPAATPGPLSIPLQVQWGRRGAITLKKKDAPDGIGSAIIRKPERASGPGQADILRRRLSWRTSTGEARRPSPVGLIIPLQV